MAIFHPSHNDDGQVSTFALSAIGASWDLTLSPVAVGQPTSPAISPAKTNNATDKWLAQCTGPEGTFFLISRKGDRYEVKLQSLDGLKTVEGMAAGDKIEFKRDGNTESIRAGSGKETGMKWLLEKKDWLIIREGEKFCRG